MDNIKEETDCCAIRQMTVSELLDRKIEEKKEEITQIKTFQNMIPVQPTPEQNYVLWRIASRF